MEEAQRDPLFSRGVPLYSTPFVLTKLDAGEIRRIKKTAFGRGESE